MCRCTENVGLCKSCVTDQQSADHWTHNCFHCILQNRTALRGLGLGLDNLGRPACALLFTPLPLAHIVGTPPTMHASQRSFHPVPDYLLVSHLFEVTGLSWVLYELGFHAFI